MPRRRPQRPPAHRALIGATLAAGAVGAGLVYRRFTTPFPYAPWALDQELPHLSTEAALAIIAPRPGERMLEIGPGTGLFSLPVARALEPGGSLEVFDIQQRMLDHTLGAAAEQGVENVRARQGDARELPYAEASFDAAYLVTVLGEIPGQARALAELRRVLRPGGRLVVGEFMFDWHAVPLALLRRRAGAAGLRYERRSGALYSYLALFTAV